jgi:probable F420-dependent oxidoreductase
MEFWASLAFAPADHYVPLAQAAERVGFHGMMMSDHIFYPREMQTIYPDSDDGVPIWEPEIPWPDTWVMVGAMAAATSRLEFGTGIYIAPLRDLFTVAKQVGTAAVVSGNRVHLGLGIGWMREEFDQTGQSFTNRGKRTDEMIPALRALWAGGWAEFHGEHYDFGPLQMEPSPSAPVPIWVGGDSEPAMRRVATLGDGWIGNPYSVEEAERRVRGLRELLVAAGRADEPFEIIVGISDPLTPEVVERVAALGVTGLVVMPWVAEGHKTFPAAAGSKDDEVGPAVASFRMDLARKIELLEEFAATLVAPSA